MVGRRRKPRGTSGFVTFPDGFHYSQNQTKMDETCFPGEVVEEGIDEMSRTQPSVYIDRGLAPYLAVKVSMSILSSCSRNNLSNRCSRS